MTITSSDDSGLSASTLGYLAGLCDASSLVWTEAGMDYSISTQTARGECANADATPLISRHENAFSPTQMQIDSLAHFLQGATGDLEHRFTTTRHRDIARSFLKRLYDDMKYRELVIAIAEDDTGADATIEMRLPSANVLLEIGWAVD